MPLTEKGFERLTFDECLDVDTSNQSVSGISHCRRVCKRLSNATESG